MTEVEGRTEEPEAAKKIVHTYPLIRHSDMVEEMKGEVMELVVTACEKHAANNETLAESTRPNVFASADKVSIDNVGIHTLTSAPICARATSQFANMAARMIKETMDKKFGPSWHTVVGEGFGFEISYECKNLLYMFFGGNLAICIWKCS